ncbi:MAG: type 2 lantipeptide synthetase LanM [Burkholderiales bacterium]|nr:type 2 lantipeptide synthetase LanM family protein [Nitrosomonas sp.]MCP5273957.1 type 2 lantipeptide synthetase LanM [Burkholderiales bacterium]
MTLAFSRDAFFRSLNLNERVNIVRSLDDDILSKVCDADRAKNISVKWLDHLLFDAQNWKIKLHSLGFSETLTQHAFSLTNSDLIPLKLEHWQSALIISPPALNIDIKANAEQCFSPLIFSFVNDSVLKLQKDISSSLRLLTIIDTQGFLQSFQSDLSQRLHRIVERVAVLEMNSARLSGHLSGSNSHERFQSFLTLLTDCKVVQSIWEEYPVLYRLLAKVSSHSQLAASQLVKNVIADYDDIIDIFFHGVNQGPIKNVHFGLGDSHRNGNTVNVLRFHSGKKIVYKPRSLDIDIHFYEVLTWLNNKKALPELKALRTLNRHDYGWVEYIEAKECSSVDEVKCFYQRQGVYLGILYALGTTDLHRENIISCGEYPIIVDLETLLHPSLENTHEYQSENMRLFAETMNSSVLSTGLLPSPLGVNRILDMSGLRGRDNQLTPYKVLQWEDPCLDTWKYRRDHVRLPAANHSPRLNNESQMVDHYLNEFIEGFQHCYQLIIKYRDEFFGDDGLLSKFSNDKSRVVLRSTQTYGVLLQESYHPDVMRDGLARDQLFDQLWFPINTNKNLARVIKSEQGSLWNNDIPLFVTQPTSKDIYTCTGEKINNFLREPALKTVTQRIEKFSSDDLVRQGWLIDAALRIESAYDNAKFDPTKMSPPANENLLFPATHLNSSTLSLDIALAIGQRLKQLAFANKSSCTWLSIGRLNSHDWRIEPCGMDLYNGLPGVTLFLAYLGHVSGDDSFTRLAQSSIKMILQEMETITPMGIGMYTGGSGIIYVLTHLSVLWSDDNLLTIAENYAEKLGKLIDMDQDFDIVDGAAGCIVALLPLYNITKSSKILNLLVRCGNHLVKYATPQKKGVGWLIRLEKSHALGGMAHGAAGIAWSLLQLWEITGVEAIKETAVQALEYERSLFSEENGNWHDLREDRLDLTHGQHNKFMSSWCHGAPGIGMARIGIYQQLPSKKVLDEINVAVTTTINYGFGGNHSLCHGDLGNMELLILLRDKIPQHYIWQHETAQLSEQLVKKLSQNWTCGIPIPVKIPGLMLGLAGIGFELLRLYDSTRVPSLFLAEGPYQIIQNLNQSSHSLVNF